MPRLIYTSPESPPLVCPACHIEPYQSVHLCLSSELKANMKALLLKYRPILPDDGISTSVLVDELCNLIAGVSDYTEKDETK